MGYTAVALALALAGQSAPASAGDTRECDGPSGALLTTTVLNSPDVGEERSVEIGQGMISSSRLSVYEGGLTLKAPVEVRGRYLFADFTATFPAGPLEPVMSPVGPAYYTPAYVFKFGPERRPRTWGRADVWLVPDPANPDGLIAHVSHGGVKQVYRVDGADFDVSRCWRLSEDSFKRELIYSGVSRGTVTIEYREFINNLARPAFSQTLQYDLNEGREVGFRGARFEILDANNTSVRYRVLRPLE